MVGDREVLLLLITTATVCVAWWQRSRIAGIAHHRLLLLALSLLNLGYAATTVEGLLPDWFPLLNGLEHLAYLAHSCCLTGWILLKTRPAQGRPNR